MFRMNGIWRCHGRQRASLVRFLFFVKRNELAAAKLHLNGFYIFKVCKLIQNLGVVLKTLARIQAVSKVFARLLLHHWLS